MNLKKTVIFLLVLAVRTMSTAQNHWDIEFNGAPVKEEVILTYALSPSGEKQQLVDSTVNYYFTDGKLDKSITKIFREDWSRISGVTNLYEGDKLIQRYLYDNDKVYAVGVVSDAIDGILPLKEKQYNDPLEAYAGQSFSTEAAYQYNNERQLVWLLSKSYNRLKLAREVEVNFSYQKNQLQSKSYNITRHSDEVKVTELVYEFEITKKDKHGWSERKMTSGEEAHISERILVLYSDDELNNPENLYKKPLPAYTLEDVMKKFISKTEFSDSVTDEQNQYLKLAIDLIEANTEEQRKESNYDLQRIYLHKAEYHKDRKEYDEAMEVIRRGMKYTSFIPERNTIIYYKALSFLSDQKGNLQEAVDYYQEYYDQTKPQYPSHLNSHETIHLAELYLRNSNQAKADELLDGLVIVVGNYLVNAPELASMDMESFEVDSFFSFMEDVADLLAKAGDLHRASSYLAQIKDYRELQYGKESDYYKDILEKLIAVKKEIITGGD